MELQGNFAAWTPVAILGNDNLYVHFPRLNAALAWPEPKKKSVVRPRTSTLRNPGCSNQPQIAPLPGQQWSDLT